MAGRREGGRETERERESERARERGSEGKRYMWTKVERERERSLLRKSVESSKEIRKQ